VTASDLDLKHFPEAFSAIHGYRPFLWQERLLQEVVEGGCWPETIAVPTGAGKTAALDIAIFHLALQTGAGLTRKAPLRIVFAVDRRIVVDQAHARAKRIQHNLESATTDVLRAVADALRRFDNDSPLHVEQLRGGLPREDDWARTPAQPTILCTTVDQLGSRLMFRGYGVSESMAPIHAGLLGHDALIILDEAHLSDAFLDTLAGVKIHQGRATHDLCLPWQVCTLTATPRSVRTSSFRLKPDERRERPIARRLAAHKIAELFESKGVAGDDEHVSDFAKQAEQLAASTGEGSTIAIVVNRVALARSILNALKARDRCAILLTGRVRPLDRDLLVEKWRSRLFASERTPATSPLFVVATQCVESGADFDFDALVTQIAPLDALRQRFGRLNRLGDRGQAPAVIVATKGEIAPKADDPIYADRAKNSWDWLVSVSSKRDRMTIDFGPDEMDALVHSQGAAVSNCVMLPKRAPVLRVADVEFFSMTNPRPFPDPHLPLFLHGEPDSSADVSIVWRADLPELLDERAIAIIGCLPPRSGEVLAVPVWTARRWLAESNSKAVDQLSDVEAQSSAEDAVEGSDRAMRRRYALRWRGALDDEAKLVEASDIRPGDTLIVPSSYGGCDSFGWAPESVEAVVDIADAAAEPYMSRHAALRLHPGLWGSTSNNTSWAAAKAALVEADPSPRAVLSALRDLSGVDRKLASRLRAFDNRRLDRVAHPYDAAGAEVGIPSGFILIAKRAKGKLGKGGRAEAVTESDEAGSFERAPILLDDHLQDVANKAAVFAKVLALPSKTYESLILAAQWHDEGKADPRFQALLHGPFEDYDSELAKTGRSIGLTDRRAAGVPAKWRHEALSVRLAAQRLLDGSQTNVDADLVLFLIGSHHGQGRPFFRHSDPWDGVERSLRGISLAPGPGPERLNFDQVGRDWSELFSELQASYGTWGLAFLEAVLRLADHRASEDAEMVEREGTEA
jgi:CRISPR-associated endonuclease/helicase Cas3